MAPPRALGRVVIGLSLLDALLGWLALQAGFVFLELVWRSVAGHENWRPLIEAHARQFNWLRAVEAVAWLATMTAFVYWWRHTPDVPAARLPLRLAWWWALVCGVVGMEAWALLRLLVAGTSLELGRGLMLVLLASVLEIALAVLTVFVVIGVQDALTPPAAGSRPG